MTVLFRSLDGVVGVHLGITGFMTARVARLAALFPLLGLPPLPAQPAADPALERAAERRFQAAEQFYAGGRYTQALRDFEAILEAMPGSRRADDAALRVARHRFEVEGDPVAAEEMAHRLLREFPVGDAIPGAHLLLGHIALASTPPRPLDARAEFERVLAVEGPAGSSWSFDALIGIAKVSSDVMADMAAAGALLSALHETNPASGSGPERFRARLRLARTLARLGAPDAALTEIAGLRADLLDAARGATDDSSKRGTAGGSGFSAGRLAEGASDLATLVTRYRAPGGPTWSLAGAVPPPRRLDEPRWIRVAEGLLHVLDQDTDELQTFSANGDFQGALGIDDPWDLAFGGPMDSPLAVVAAEDALVVGGNTVRLAIAAGGRPEPLRRIRAVAVTPEGYWVWDDREKGVFRFARSGPFIGRVPHPRLDEVVRIERHPAGHLVVLDERQGVLAFDSAGRRIFHLRRERGVVEPVDLAFDDLGNLFVLDRVGPGLSLYDREFAVLATRRGGEWSGGSLRRPISLDVGPDGSLFVLDEATRAVTVFR